MKIFGKFFCTTTGTTAVEAKLDKVELAEPLYFLNLCGLGPLQQSKHLNILKGISVASFVVTVALGLMEIFFNFKGFDTVSRASEVIFPQYEHSWKFVVLILYRKQLGNLVTNTEQLWSLDALGEEARQQVLKPHKYFKRAFKIYKVLMIASILNVVLTPIFYGGGKPIVLCYGENDDLGRVYDVGVYLLQSFHVTVVVCLILGCDGLVFYFVAHIITELRLVKICFGDYNIEPKWDAEERFRNAAQHHSFILKFVGDMDNIYSRLLLHQHFCCLFGICFGLFLMSLDGTPPDINHITQFSPYIFSFVMQCFTFCFAGNLLIEWSREIPEDVFYGSYATGREVSSPLGAVVAIKRSQKPAKLTLGGFGDLDLESFSMVMQKAFSFYTFMNALWQGDDESTS